MKRYKSFTLLEVLIVMAIMLILMTISVVAYRSLIDSFTINETSLTIAQDIRSTQRAAMLLDREGNERWLYGIGIDFTKMVTERKYEIFKWCSPYNYYDQKAPSLTGEVPKYFVGANFAENTRLPLSPPLSHCNRGQSLGEEGLLIVETKDFAKYDNLNFVLGNVNFILFESVSGKAFLYDSNRDLLNYKVVGEEMRLDNPFIRFILNSESIRGAGGVRGINVLPVSGRIFFKYE